MPTLKSLRLPAIVAFLIFLPEAAHAYGGIDIQIMLLSVIRKFWPLWVITGILVLVIAGFSLMTTQEEGRLEKAKKTLIAVTVGGILITIIMVMGELNFIGIFFNQVPGFTVINSAGAVALEAMGIAQWIAAFAVILGVLFIVIAVLRAVASLGDEGAYTNARVQLLHVIAGVVLIAGAYLVELAFFGSAGGPGQVVTNDLGIQPNPLLQLIAENLLIILNVILLIAVGILIYAGLRMIISFGREEEYTNAKNLAIRVVVGILVLVLSYSLVFIVAAIFT